MPYLIDRSRWQRQPVEVLREIDRSGWWAAGMWAALAIDGRSSYDLLRMNPAQELNMGGRQPVPRSGLVASDYVTANHVSGIPYYWATGLGGGVVSTTSMTLAAVLVGHGLTPQTTRAQISSSLAGNPFPGIFEGSGSANVWGAGFRTASSTDVRAWSTVDAPAGGLPRVLFAVYRNGVGVELYIDGQLAASTSSTLNLAGTPGLVQGGGGSPVQDTSPLTLAWRYALSPGQIEALSENIWQVLRPQDRPIVYSIGGGGGPDLVAEAAASSTVAGTGALSQTHALSADSAASATAASSGVVPQTHALAAASATSATAASTGAVSQAAALAAAAAASATAASTGAVSQTHVLAAASATSATAASTGAVSQAGVLSAAAAASATAASTGAVSQTHVLAAAGATSATAASTPTVVTAGTLVAAAAVSATAASAPAVTQDHLLTAADAVAAGLLTAAQVGQVHVLVAAPAQSATQASGGAVSGAGGLSAAPAISGSALSNPAVAQTHLLAAVGATSATALSLAALTGAAVPGGRVRVPAWFRVSGRVPVRFRQ